MGANVVLPVKACLDLELHSSDSHTERVEEELVLDVCDAASENTDEVEEDAEEEREEAYGWLLGEAGPRNWE